MWWRWVMWRALISRTDHYVYTIKPCNLLISFKYATYHMDSFYGHSQYTWRQQPSFLSLSFFRDIAKWRIWQVEKSCHTLHLLGPLSSMRYFFLGNFAKRFLVFFFRASSLRLLLHLYLDLICLYPWSLIPRRALRIFAWRVQSTVHRKLGV